MEFVQVFSEKIATMLKNTVLVAYLVHVLLLNSFAVHRRWLVENG